MVEVQGVLKGWKLVQLATQYGDVDVSYSLLGALRHSCVMIFLDD